MGSRAISQPRSAVKIAIMGLVLIVAYAVTGTLQALVWNPLAAVPGATLEVIHAGLDQANESLDALVVLTWAVIGVLLAVIVLLRALVRPDFRVKKVLALDLLLLVWAAPSHWYAAFGAGMGIADAFATDGGDHTQWGVVLYGISAAALVALLVLVITKPKSTRV